MRERPVGSWQLGGPLDAKSSRVGFVGKVQPYINGTLK